MTPTPNPPAKGLLITAIGGLTLTADIPLIRLADGAPWSILMMRTGTTFLAALVIWAVWRLATPKAPQLIPGRAGLAATALYGIAAVTFIAAVFNTSTANLVFILAFNPVFSALLSWLFLGERPRPATFLTMAAMIVGVAIIVSDSMGSGHLWGDVLALSTALCIAGAIPISRASGKDMGFTPLVGVVLPFLVAAFVVGKSSYQVSEPGWIVFNGAVIMPVSFFCLAAGPRYISGPEVSMFYLLETVLAPVWVWMIFSEVPSRNSLIGGAILIVSLVAHSLWQLREGRRRRAAAAMRHPV